MLHSRPQAQGSAAAALLPPGDGILTAGAQTGLSSGWEGAWQKGMPAKSTKHSAVGPYLGFGLQTVRLCARLLTEPRDATVYVEHDDDVSVHYAGGTRLLEQAKKKASNPLADWSIDLWKTIHNWLEDHSPIGSGNISALCLFVAPKHVPGPWVEALLAAKSASDIATLVADIEKAITSAKKKSATYPFVKRFLDASPDEQLALAVRFSVICQPEPTEMIRELYAPSVSTPLLDRIVAYALGEAKHRTDRLLEMSKPGGLNAGEFQDLIRVFVQSINLPAYFGFDSAPPSTEDVDAAFSSKPVFIRQLELINVGKSQQLNAVSDYLRTVANKTKWGAEGILLPRSLDEWDANLLSRHAAICDSFEATHGHLDEVKMGAAIYAECRKLSVALQGKTVPDHFTHGCLNELSEDRKLGWHPNFNDLLD